jgi:transcriptional regulator with XRE-family HTH domain/tetratricopeptide (TPR) repeat protein
MAAPSSLSFGALLKRHRRAAGLTQEQLAERAGYSVSYISMLERGERVPVRATVELVADALGLATADSSALEAAAREAITPAALPSSAGPLQSVPGLAPLVGRAAELERVAWHLSGDGPPLLLLAGEPGIGKSRLLASARMRAEATGWRVVSGSSQRRGGQMPFAPVLDALERDVAAQSPAGLHAALQGCAWLARLLPELTDLGPLLRVAWPLPPEQERRLVFAAVGRYLANVAGPAGTLLILDDLQWAEADALDLLNALIRATHAARLRVLGAYRDAEVAPNGPLAVLLADFAAAGLVVRQALGPLTTPEAAALVSHLLPQEARHTAQLERAVARGGGIPFFLVSYAQSLAAASYDAPSSEDALAEVPWDVAQTIRQRIAALPEAAQSIVELGALAGRSVTRGLLLTAGAAQDPDRPAFEETLATALDAACRARILIEDGYASYTFVHEPTREVVLQGIGSARRAALHRRLALTLARVSGEPPAEALAYHYAQAGEPEHALPHLEQAAKRARAMQAFSASAGYYRELADTLEQLHRTREAALARDQLGEALILATDYRAAVEAHERAARLYRLLGDAAAEGRAVAQIGQAYAASGDAAAGIARLEPLLAAPTSALPPDVLAALADALAQLYHVGGRYADQLAATTRAAEHARAAGDAQLLAQTQMRHGNALRMLGRFGEATVVLEETIRLAEAADDQQTLSYALENVSVVYLLQGKLEQAGDYVRRALDLVRPLGDPIVVALMTLRRGMTSFVVGAWDAARADFEQAEAMMRGGGVAWVSAYTATGLGQIRLAQGELEGAVLLEAGVELAGRSGDLQALRWAQTALAEWEILAGRPAAAGARLEPLLDRPGQQEGLVTYLLPYLAWADGVSDRPDHARAYIAACQARARTEHIHLALVDALRVEALLALEAGNAQKEQMAGATRALEESLALCRAMPYPYAEAKALYVFGLVERARGGAAAIAAARDRWRDALRLLGALGERLYAERIQAALDELPEEPSAARPPSPA